MPYFSVIIPTRNRPDLVPIALQSVLEQDFDDFEVIVSDNSDEEESMATRDALEPLLADARVRYVRPPQVMPMVEHWEWVTRQARGEFIGVLTDRMSYRLYTLSRCREAIQAYATDLVSFRMDGLTSDTPPYSFRAKDNPTGASLCKSSACLRDCSRSHISIARLPRMLNSFCRASQLDRLIQEYGSIYTGQAPDYSFCFRILDQIDSFVSLDDRLLVSGGESRSNGFAFSHNKMNEDSRDFLARSVTSGKWLDYAPLPASLQIGKNVVLLEYEVARRQQRSGRFPLIDEAAFYRQARRDLQKRMQEGYDLTDALRALEAYRVEHNIPPRPPVDHLRRAVSAMGVRRARPAMHAFGRRIAALATTLTGRSPPIDSFRGFPTVIELLRRDAATAEQARER